MQRPRGLTAAMGAPAALMVAAVMALGAGCGGGGSPAPSDQQQASTAVRSFLRAVAAGDGAASCQRLTAAAQRRIVMVVAQAAQSFGAAPATCAEAVSLAHAAVPVPLRTAIRDARVQDVAVAGDRATARVTDGAAFGTQRVTLVHRDGRWLIDRAPSLTGG